MKRLAFVMGMLCLVLSSYSQTPDITAMEYYVDVDPGFGSGTPVSISPDSLQDVNVSIPTLSLSPGVHVLYIRSQDVNGAWSHAESKPFFIAKSTSQSRNNLTSLEYYVDLDPGQGNGTPVTVTPDTDLNLVELIPTVSLTPGFHTLYFRTQDAAGVWSMPENAPFFISKSTSETQTDIDAVEYFIDMDPGHGNGIAVAVTPAPNVDLVEQIPTDTLSPGFHSVFFRIRDAAGQWSTTESEPFFISKSTSQVSTDIAAVEYFYDIDPGQGNGIPVTVTPASNLDLMEQLTTDTLGLGFHTVHFRVLDASGQWSLPESKPFYISTSTSQTRTTIVAMEYFLDVDPGFGNGESVTVSPGMDLDENIPVPVESLSPGFHSLAIRVLDDQGEWSHFESQPFFKDPIRTINTVEYAFDTDPGNGFATPIEIVPPQNPLDSLFSIFIDTLTADEHDLILRVRDGLGAWSLTDTMRFEKLSIPPGNALDFDGIDDVAIVPDAATLDFDTGDFTVEMWVKKKEASTAFENTYAINKWMNAGTNPGQNEWTLSLTTGGDNDIPQFAVESGTTVYSVSAADPLMLNQWHHLAGVRDDSVLYLYVDGILQDSTTLPTGTGINNVGRDLYFGRSADPQFETKARFDEARIWNVARTYSQIDSAMNSILNGDENGLVAYYRFDQGVPGGSNATITSLPDRSSNNHTGTLNNFVLNGMESNWILSDVLVGPTTVVSIDRNDPTPTNSDAVSWNVSFTKPVVGLTASNFSLLETDFGGSVISNVTDIDGVNWQVDVQIGNGVGDLQLDVSDGITGLTPSLSNVPFFGAPYRVDRLPPVMGVDGLSTSDPTPALSGTIDDMAASVEVTVDGQTLVAINNGDGTWFLGNDLLDSLASGTYDVIVSGIDSLGNTGMDGSTNELIIDRIPPVVSVDLLITNDTVPGLSGSVNDLVAAIEVTVVDSTYTVNNNGDGSWSLPQGVISPGLAEGVYDIVVTATDALGNSVSDTTDQALEIDLVAPVVTVDPRLTNVGSPALTGTVNDSTTSLLVTINDSTYTATNQGDGTWTLPAGVIMPVLFAGVYEVEVVATDPAGNAGSDGTTNELEIDTTIPDVTVDVLITKDTSPQLTGTVNDPSATIAVTIDSTVYAATNNGDGTWTLINGVISPALSEGTYDVLVTATTLAGATGSDNTLDELVVDVTSPVVTVQVLATEDPRPELSGTIDEVTSNIDVEINGNSYPAIHNGDSTWTLPDNVISPDLPLGVHDVIVRAVDPAGNVGVDNTVNELEILVPLIGLQNDSLMLVSIFEQNGGNQWPKRDNWLIGPLPTWQGVEVSNNRVTAVDLSSNNVKSTIAITSGFDKMTEFDLADNEIEDVTGIDQLTELLNLNVSKNRLVFEVIDRLINAGPTVDYTDQKPVLLPSRALKQIGRSYVMNRTVPGGEMYEWFVDSQPLSGTGPTMEFNDISFEDEGDYFVSVTSSLVPDLTLTSTFAKLRVSSLKRDSLALMAIREIVSDNSVLSADWEIEIMDNWQEITIRNNPKRVTDIDMSGLGLTGALPDDILDIGALESADFSNNEITFLPDLAPLDSIQLFDISDNKLDFSSIEPNATINGINFNDQDSLGIFRKELIRAGANIRVETKTEGDALRYQWMYRPDSIGEGNDGYIKIDSATRSFYQIEDIDYRKMGRYVVEASSDLVENGAFKLVGRVQEMLASGSIEITPTFEFVDSSIGTLDQGEGRLFRIRGSGPFDTVKVAAVEAEKILFEDVVLGDYLVNVRTEPEYFIVKSLGNESFDTVSFIPTYFQREIDWLQADTIKLRDLFSESMEMERTPADLDDPFQEGRVMLTVESDFQEISTSGRVEARRRVKKAGCSLRRRRTTGGGRPEEDHDFELIAYKETGDDGQVNFGLLPDGLYRLNIQYPGVPMDPASFLEFEINSMGGVVGYELEATVTTEGIFVERILGLEGTLISGLAVYPNPADNELNITYRKLGKSSVKAMIVDLYGRKLHDRHLEQGIDRSLKMDLSDLNSGIYLLKLFTEGPSETQLATYRIIVQR